MSNSPGDAEAEGPASATEAAGGQPEVTDLGLAGTPPAADANEAPMTVEDLIETLELVTTQRDEYLATAQRVQAEFDNFRRRTAAEAADRAAAGAARLAEALLPVLDTCDTAASQGDDSMAAIQGQLHAALEREGLERVPAAGEPFDPNVHEAVMHEAGDGEPTVAEELRPGYLFKGRVLRAAMVKVQG